MQTMLHNVKRQKAPATKGPATPEAPTEEITPDPGFVIKTTETKTGDKIFINVCWHDRVAAPGGWSNGVMPDEVAAALEKLQVGFGRWQHIHKQLAPRALYQLLLTCST